MGGSFHSWPLCVIQAAWAPVCPGCSEGNMLTFTSANTVAARPPPSWVYCCVDSRRPELEPPLARTLPG